MIDERVRKAYRIDGKVLRKSVLASRHFLRTPPAIAIDAQILQEAMAQGVEFIQVYDRENGTYFTASMERFRKKGFWLNRGYGEQIGLLLKEWCRSQSPETPKGETKYAENQPCLF